MAAKITEKDVTHIAALSRLKLSADETMMLGRQLNDILLYIEKLNELDTKDIEPTSHILPLKNVYREDRTETPLERDAALSNAPDKNERFYKVAKIIE
ncbi:Asp-tRNA(Asn)/Glu-tRNA(Gln) amidotransferase subunit GatC [Candidatus Magnetominusculus xianensis]|uniref:Aspartyl/glutamyl-tRNA(Asn/Gln) amidotransferase subunit C n=1 Tax=Candidatus Magnetominusculus xianensis TaxID=1748249 RepID=A0ABR5SHM5_9BACT|nr:Asp-tRNA(Asn)/Glu-tRNA(Gln) amidotransferase subunit GatC [Candidatus Magnetominusculus xianensis]KWT91660.1 glutamyl-tRNA amidotransferase subunit C [Candidatus Magnetominusculus xianensis]MBF0404583.1 Asp-tRNA(Asn)/Glu-tRNA(Gln) amidotransferase subunit GatC [Nitrospirota bacterium]